MAARRRARVPHARLDRTVRIGAGVRQRAGVVARSAGAGHADPGAGGRRLCLAWRQRRVECRAGSTGCFGIRQRAGRSGLVSGRAPFRQSHLAVAVPAVAVARYLHEEDRAFFRALGRTRAGGGQVRAWPVDGIGADGGRDAGAARSIPALRRVWRVAVGSGGAWVGRAVRRSGAGRAALSLHAGLGRRAGGGVAVGRLCRLALVAPPYAAALAGDRAIPA